MAVSLADIRDQIKTRLGSVTGLRAYDTVADQPQVPCAIVIPDPDTFIDYHGSFGSTGHTMVRFNVQVMVLFTVDRVAQDQLDGFLSAGASGGHSTTTSVFHSLESTAVVTDATLGGQVVADGVQNYGAVTFEDGTRYLSATIPIRVLCSRS